MFIYSISVIMFHVADPGSIGVIQEEEAAKLAVFIANLLGNIDHPLHPLESNALQHSRAVCSVNRKNIRVIITSIGVQCKYRDGNLDQFTGQIRKAI